MERFIYFIIILSVTWRLGTSHTARDFDDTILYKIDFLIPPDIKDDDFEKRYDVQKFTTGDKEVYQCAIPIADTSWEKKNQKYSGLSPLHLIAPIFSPVSCTYRIEAYWSYEICHGYHIKQYHEERDGKNIKFQEYYLGHWSAANQEKLAEKMENDLKNGVKIKTTNIEGVQFPYLELEMGNGTLCDINNEPRTTKIRYVCYFPDRHNTFLYSIKETSSCHYEAIVLTRLLCLHPAYLPEAREISIKCYNSPESAQPPLSMLKLTLEDVQTSNEDIFGLDAWSVLDKTDLHKLLETVGQTDSTNNAELPPILPGEDIVLSKDKWSELNPIAMPKDFRPLYSFLFGNCITGGGGWWKYEFCYGRYVRQFHKDQKSESELILGLFKEDAHREWLKENPLKRHIPSDTDSAIWHHYVDGIRCDKTGKPRETDVKLMCVVSSSASSLSMYLLEPKTCQYILVVESPMVCALQSIVDQDGLISEERFLRDFLKLNKNKESIETATPNGEEHKEERNQEEEKPIDEEFLIEITSGTVQNN